MEVLLTVTEVKRQLGSSQEYSWQETAQSLNLPDAQLQEDIWLASPADVKLTIRNGGDRLVFDGSVSADLRLICGRCLVEYRDHVCYPIEDQLLFARQAGAVGRSVADSDEDRELDVLEGDSVDVTAMVRDAFISLLPVKPLCREDCRGLCPICGADLNTESCNCSDTVSDPRLAALAAWLEKK